MQRNKKHTKQYTRERIRKKLFENEPHLYIRRVEIKRREDSEDINLDVKFYEHPADIWRVLSELEEHEEWHTKLIHERGGWVLKITMETQSKQQIYEAGKEEAKEIIMSRSNKIGKVWKDEEGWTWYG